MTLSRLTERTIMLRSIKQLYGNHLGANDGEIGHVKDFYFDDQSWAIRYVVVDTGTWLPGRRVLLSPYSLGRLDQKDKILRVNLTRKQIEDSPSIEEHKPVSRQYEEEYYRYYGWPYYWEGGAVWGMTGFPILATPPMPLPGKPAGLKAPPIELADRPLRSTKAVTGYQLRTMTAGIIGYVNDFMMDAEQWTIGQFAIKTGHRFSGEEMMMPTKYVDRVSYEDSTVFATLADSEVKPETVTDKTRGGSGAGD